MGPTTPPAGPAPDGTERTVGLVERAVRSEYERALQTHRRWTLLDRAITGALLTGTVAALVFAVIGILTGHPPPAYLTFAPLPPLVLWLLLHGVVLRLFGRPAAPEYPAQAIAVAARADAAAAGLLPWRDAAAADEDDRAAHRRATDDVGDHGDDVAGPARTGEHRREPGP